REGAPRHLGAARLAARGDDVQGLHPSAGALARDADRRGARPGHQARDPQGPQHVDRHAERARRRGAPEALVRKLLAAAAVAGAVLAACSVQHRATDPQPTLPSLTAAEVQPPQPAPSPALAGALVPAAVPAGAAPPDVALAAAVSTAAPAAAPAPSPAPAVAAPPPPPAPPPAAASAPGPDVEPAPAPAAKKRT